MREKDELMEDLNSMVPVSPEFKKKLGSILRLRKFRNRHILMHLNKLAAKAWQVIGGHVLAILVDDNEEETVVKIYEPRMIATDIHSFFKATPTRFKMIAVGNTKVLELKKKDFDVLYNYPETDKLIQYIVLLEEEREAGKTEMLKLPPLEKVRLFLSKYSVSKLPDKYCASFLAMSEDEYIEQKHLLGLSKINVSELKPSKIQQLAFSNSKNMVHEVRQFILSNYADPDLGHTSHIAAIFNTTRKTLSREFRISFDTTVHDQILSLRMEKALLLLKERKYDIGEVATAVGYPNIQAFCRVFRRYFGYTASQFSKM